MARVPVGPQIVSGTARCPPAQPARSRSGSWITWSEWRCVRNTRVTVPSGTPASASRIVAPRPQSNRKRRPPASTSVLAPYCRRLTGGPTPVPSSTTFRLSAGTVAVGDGETVWTCAMAPVRPPAETNAGAAVEAIAATATSRCFIQSIIRKASHSAHSARRSPAYVEGLTHPRRQDQWPRWQQTVADGAETFGGWRAGAPPRSPAAAPGRDAVHR